MKRLKQYYFALWLFYLLCSIGQRLTDYIETNKGGIILLSEYGKTLRKIRIDKGLTMATMAKAIGVTSSFLSMVEQGKRNIPNGLTQLVIKHYSLSNEQAAELQKAELLSRNSIEIELSKVDVDKKSLALSLAKNLKNITCEQVSRINKIMEES